MYKMRLKPAAYRSGMHHSQESPSTLARTYLKGQDHERRHGLNKHEAQFERYELRGLSYSQLLHHVTPFAGHASFPRHRRCRSRLLLKDLPELETLVRG